MRLALRSRPVVVFALQKAAPWRTSWLAALALLAIGSAMLGNAVRYRHYQNSLRRTLAAQSTELAQARQQLLAVTRCLASAEGKLGYLRQHKTAVQVTAYTGRGRFANGLKTEESYAVPAQVLPQDKVLNVALSPAAQRELRARMNDYIVLLDRSQGQARLARFVDTTSAKELRPVVDVFFARRSDAIAFGRQRFYAVNISAKNSPFNTESDAFAE